ncbi:hypothetical protein SAMN05421771_1846 [Granulicella pectinivorans]|uniref:Uncharacterized protein n=1 Tax=Granulicella pectinivorans TaxID=474950 RepID=A0A1I6M4W3_9BACT|nr:hypothetical protein [Granulicella pectinivorans]SFS10777.1 hypothetical protein SAMN05421771_1846 [Granulicella pectinivorans]
MTFDTPDDQQPVSSVPDTGDDNTQPQQTTQDQSVATVAVQQPTQPQPANEQDNAAVVSNAAAVPAAQAHPAIQKASVLRSVAETLAGGPRFTTSIDATTGATTRTKVPLSSRDIGLAIAMEAVTGALGGLAVTGPGATGRAAAAGYQQVSQAQQQAQQKQEQQAQQDFQNQSQQLARRASIYEANSRGILNTSEAEARGADALDKLTDINRASGVLDVSPDLLDNGGTPMTQAELLDSLKTGKLSPTDQLGPVAGRVEITNPDGSKRWEATHLIIKDPGAPVALTQDDWNRYADGGVPGFPKGTKVGGGLTIPLRMKVNANEQLASHYLAAQRLHDLSNVLDGTQYASKVPQSIDFSKPGVNTAMQRFQTYVSHDAANLQDPFAALQAMGQAKRDPKTGQIQPNPDAKYVDAVASVFGGWSVLEAAHDQLAANQKSAEQFSIIDSEAKAQAVLAAPQKFSKDQLSAASNFVRISQSESITKATAEARAHAIATGADREAMMKTGVNPISGEKLTLQNAPDSMLVDPRGNVVPQNQQALYKPTAQERQTADTARQVLAISSDLQAQIARNPGLIGPLSGNSAKAFAPFGIGTEAAQKMLDNVSLLQSAVTKMHTGRFSSEILKKSGSLIFPGMNNDQFAGAMDSLKDVAGRYANEDQLTTVASFRQQQQNASSLQSQPQQGSGQPDRVVPVGATPGRDPKTGVILGYRTADGKVVKF